MLDKTDQTAYIKYLEDRLAKLSQQSSISNQDLSNLIDAENEITANASFALKWVLNEKNNLAKQIEHLQKKSAMSEAYIEYLLNSYWWKATYPFRLISRNIKKHQNCKPFNFSHKTTIEDEITVIVYANNPSCSLEDQIDNIRQQKNIKNARIVIMDLVNSVEIARIAKSNNTEYINTLSVNSDTFLINKILNNAKYLVYIGQDVFINDPHWLYKMVKPLIENYAILSALYDGPPPKIKNVKNETFFNELKIRIFKVGLYECILFPANRDNVQYVPPFIINEASIIAKKGDS